MVHYLVDNHVSKIEVFRNNNWQVSGRDWQSSALRNSQKALKTEVLGYCFFSLRAGTVSCFMLREPAHAVAEFLSFLLVPFI